jgi:hypothetical protein
LSDFGEATEKFLAVGSVAGLECGMIFAEVD